jgi:uncharacterized membrane protein
MNFIILGIGLTSGIIGLIVKLRKPHYQKEKTTSGRTIRYLDYQESKKHLRNKIIGVFLIGLGIVLIGIGLYVTMLGDN